VIRPGDMIQTVGGVTAGGTRWTLTAEVLTTSREGARRGHLIVRPVCVGHERTTRDIRTSDVVRHWRLARGRA